MDLLNRDSHLRAEVEFQLVCGMAFKNHERLRYAICDRMCVVPKTFTFDKAQNIIWPKCDFSVLLILLGFFMISK